MVVDKRFEYTNDARFHKTIAKNSTNENKDPRFSLDIIQDANENAVSEPDEDIQQESLVEESMFSGLPTLNVQYGQPTNIFSVVHFDYDIIRATDLFVLFNSINKGLVSVKVYLSDFGLKKMEEEAKLTNNTNNEETEILKMKRIMVQKMDYYYAVVECTDVEVAKILVEQCDSQEIESSGNVLDLRYVPKNMTFDESRLVEVCTQATVENKEYIPIEANTKVMTNTNASYEYDEVDLNRKRVLNRMYTEQELDNNISDIENYIASNSDSAPDNELAPQIYKKLLKDIDDQNVKVEEQLQVSFKNTFDNEPSSCSSSSSLMHSDNEQVKKDTNTLDSVGLYKLKEKKKRELKRSKKLVKKTQTKAETNRNSLCELELLVADSNQNKHFDYNEVIKEQNNHKEDEFEIDTNDNRFEKIHNNYDYAIDPTNPKFKRTKAMTQLVKNKNKSDHYYYY